MRLEPTVAQNVVSYVTVIDVPNKEMKLKPGMTANVTVEIERADNVLRVPNAALRFRPAQVTRRVRKTAPRATQPQAAQAAAREPGMRGPSVWVLRDGQLLPVRVRPAVSDGTVTAIVDGELTEDHAGGDWQRLPTPAQPLHRQPVRRSCRSVRAEIVRVQAGREQDDDHLPIQ